jgi:hypothetical protein
LLDYYATCKATVIRANENFGHLALWHSKLYHRLKWNYFVYTDSDVLPVEACPPDFISYLQSQVRWSWQLDKVGFGIVIDDLPEAFSLKEKVVAYESRYWQKQIKPGIYDAPIDTTLALYRPFSNLNQGHSFTMCSWRTGRPYVLRHLPWYVDSANLDQEEKFYRAHANQSSSLVKQESGQEKIY